ncbi:MULTISPECIES: GntR family transcriptional regulator [unclassified Aureimonas]|uniref:GntR family transcriptional regulator n=1 Tax=unclassified Aureimonas TaxID=2615206 RepID=UPI000A4542E9|nr:MULTISPECIES: GntR family transcriptional regulator [unclassified Aureimonas]
MVAFERKPAYASMTEMLRESMTRGSIPAGTVILESHLATLFNSSRAPVRQALATLEAEGLLGRFAGRGLVVGPGSSPTRIPITREMVTPAAEPGVLPDVDPADAIYYAVERNIILHSLFGGFRVNELALARAYDISRLAARNLLLRAQGVGIVGKGEKSHWWIVPLNLDRMASLYELREILEPVALQNAANSIPPILIEEIAVRHRVAIERFPEVDIATLDELEDDIHVKLLGFSTNHEIIGALKRGRALFVSTKHIQIALKRTALIDPFLDEHLAVVEALGLGEIDAAARGLRDHLHASNTKSLRNLAHFNETQKVEPVDYILSQ